MNTNNQSDIARESNYSHESGGLDITTMFLASLVAAIIVLSGIYGFREPILHYIESHIGELKTSPRIVYVDAEKLFNAQIKKSLQKHVDSPAKSVFDSSEFAIRLNAILQSYSDANYLVLNKKSVLKGVSGRDITATVASKLGLSDLDDSIPNIAD